MTGAEMKTAMFIRLVTYSIQKKRIWVWHEVWHKTPIRLKMKRCLTPSSGPVFLTWYFFYPLSSPVRQYLFFYIWVSCHYHPKFPIPKYQGLPYSLPSLPVLCLLCLYYLCAHTTICVCLAVLLRSILQGLFGLWQKRHWFSAIHTGRYIFHCINWNISTSFKMDGYQ